MARKKKELDRFDSTAKRDVPIVVKLLSVIFSAVVLSVAGVTALSLNIFSSGFRDATDEDLMNFSQGLDMTLKDWRSTLESDVMMLSNRPDISPMINSSNAHDLNAIVGCVNGTLCVDVLAFTDSFGKIISGEGVSSGENISSVSSVQSALRGIAGYSFDEIGKTGYSMIATAPVRYQGKVAGTVVAAYSLINGNIVNQVAKSYSAACTIFKGYMRVSSTLGDKYIGTSLDNTTITDAVIKDGNEYHGTNIDELVAQIKAAMKEQNDGSQQISEALAHMNASTQKVQEASKEMSQRNEKIMNEIKVLKDSTAHMQEGMNEMSSGADRINETGTALAAISGDVQGAINKIGSQIDLFKTE